MHKFKPGDKVRCINGDDNILELGEVYIVKNYTIGITGDLVRLMGQDIHDAWYERRFELVEKAKREIKVFPIVNFCKERYGR